jgi:hypothetical protein
MIGAVWWAAQILSEFLRKIRVDHFLIRARTRTGRRKLLSKTEILFFLPSFLSFFLSFLVSKKKLKTQSKKPQRSCKDDEIMGA